MAALCGRNRPTCERYILPYSGFYLLLSSSFFSSPILIGRKLDVCHNFHTWCGLSVNLECMSEMCCKRLPREYRIQKWRKNRHLQCILTIAQLCRAISSQLRHVSTIGKKLVKQQYLFHCSHNMLNFRPLTTEIGSGVWATPANFNGFLRLGFVTATTSLNGSQPNFALCLAIFWTATLYIRPIHFQGALVPWWNFARCKIHFPSKSCVLLYLQRYCTSLQQLASAKLSGVVQGMELRNFRRGCHLFDWAASADILDCVSKKFPPFDGLLLCQILTDFQNFCTARKRIKFATKRICHYPPHVRHVATLPWKLKIQIFCTCGRKRKQIVF